MPEGQDRWVVSTTEVPGERRIGVQIGPGDTDSDLLRCAESRKPVKQGCLRLTGETEDTEWPSGRPHVRWFTYEQICPCPEH